MARFTPNNNNEIIEKMKQSINDVIDCFDQLEDLQLSNEEKASIEETYDTLTVHGSISLEAIQDSH